MSDEIKVFEVNLSVGQITTNFEEVKKSALEYAEKYKAMTFSDDAVADAKKAIAEVNKVIKAINAQRIADKKKWNEPIVQYEQRCKDLEKILNDGVEDIKKFVDSAETKRIDARKAEIGCIFDALNPFDWLTLDKIKNEKWLNKTTTEAVIQAEIKARLDLIKITIDSYNADFNDKYLPILINAYQQTLDDQFARNKRREAIDNDKRIEAAAASKKEQEKTADAPAHSGQIEVAANNQEQQEQTTAKRAVVRLELEVTPESWSKLKAAIKADPNIVVLKCEF